MKNTINAGEFSIWLNDFTQTMKGNGEGNVPCGDCVGCCTSSKFIHIRPTDKETLKNVPKEVLFQAPSLPKDHYLMGYNEKGYCPMFKEGKCSIYNFRPETCRQYDCRVLAASELSIIKEESPDIVKQVQLWAFEYTSQESQILAEAVKLAGAFLSKYSHEFPKEFVPHLNSQKSVLAIRIHTEFFGHSVDSAEANYKSIIATIVSKYSN